MAKIYISHDEWYPVFTISREPDGGDEVEITDVTLGEWEAAFQMFRGVQRNLRELYGWDHD